jgi:ankyrin repeat protein
MLAAQNGVDVEAKDSKDSTAVYWAASRGQADMVLFLVQEANANPSAANVYRSPLHVAAGNSIPAKYYTSLTSGRGRRRINTKWNLRESHLF